MIRFISSNKIINVIVLLLIIWSSSAISQTKVDYAESLMKEKDYFRAISAYKELAFFSKNEDSTIFFLTQIGRAYRLSRKYELSIDLFSSLMTKHPKSKSQLDYFNINLGLNYIGLKVSSQALPYLEKTFVTDSTGYAYFFAALAECERSNWKKASDYYYKAGSLLNNQEIKMLSLEFSSKVLNGDKIPKKNIFLTTAMSSIIPGLGQYYCGHYFDAAQAFVFVSSFAFVSYAIYRYDRDYNSNYVLTGVSI
ncbi:MAG: hypothetical protein QME52_08715 [Bacteroidota bacterium]|nr:hypothetical protein [Bacteroidota bacterium]